MRGACVAVVAAGLMFAIASPTSPASDPQARGRAVLEAALARSGDPGEMARLHGATIEFESEVDARAQGASPASTGEIRREQGAVSLDRRGERFDYTFRTEFRGGIQADLRAVVDGVHGFVHNRRNGEVNDLLPPILAALRGGLRQSPRVLLPHLVLDGLRDPRSELAWVDEVSVDGATVDVLEARDPLSGALRRVHLRRSDGRALRIEGRDGEVHYEDYRSVEGVALPHRWRYTRGGETVETRRALRVSLGTVLDPASLVVPEGVPRNPKRPPMQLEELAPGVYRIEVTPGLAFNYNAFFVVLDTYVVLFDAPLAPLLGQALLDAISSVAGERPVRFVVPTHFHADHVGGIVPVLETGATLVTTEGNRAFFKMMAGPNVAIETMTVERRFAESDRSVVVLELPKTSHVDEMLMAYIPHHGIVYVADLFSSPLSGAFPAPPESTREFAAFLSGAGLEVSIVVPSHGRPVTYAEFLRAVAPRPTPTGVGGR